MLTGAKLSARLSLAAEGDCSYRIALAGGLCGYSGHE